MSNDSHADDAFTRFSHSFETWKNLTRPTKNMSEDHHAPTRAIDVALDHIADHLLTVGSAAANRSTEIDWVKIVPENLVDLDAASDSLNTLAVAEDQKTQIRRYISECRALWEQMLLLPVPPEGHLGFRKAVLDRFQFLEASGFRVTESTPIRVRYQRVNLYAELEYSLESPELIFCLGQLQEGKESHVLWLDDFFYAAGLGLLADYRQFNLESRAGVEAFVDWAAGIIKDNSKAVMDRKSDGFQLLLAKQNERERTLAEQGPPGRMDS